MTHPTNNSGFALVTVIIFCLAALIIGAATLVATSTAFTASQSQYNTKIAEEAAEAGLAYASSCLETNSRNQTWGPTDYQGTSRPSLKQNTNCDGSTNASVSSVLVASDNRLVTEFEVGNLDFTSSSATQVNSVQISAKGYAKVKNGSGGFGKTYEATAKKVIVWPANLAAEASASGSSKTCAILSGSIYCWGRNYSGQLGNGTNVDSFIPVKVLREAGVMAGTTATDIFSAETHNCAVANGAAYCWGSNAWGQLGNGNRTSSYKPVKVGGALAGLTVTAVGGTGSTSCALINTGKVYCWGKNSYGTVGNNATPNPAAPSAPPPPAAPGATSTNHSFTTPQPIATTGGTTGLASNYVASGLSTSGSRSQNMCLIASGVAYCWGPDDAGQIGDGGTISATEIKLAPTKVTGLLTGKTVTAISQDGWPPDATSGQPTTHVCAVASGAIYCWGENNTGQLGNNSLTDSSSPVAVATNTGLTGTTTQVVVGIAHSCALRADGNVYCWGSNTLGQTGNNGSTGSRYSTPVAIYTDPGAITAGSVTQIGGGANRGCAITTEAKSYCWGFNNEGQIGDGTLQNRPIPTESLFLRPKYNQYIY